LRLAELHFKGSGIDQGQQLPFAYLLSLLESHFDKLAIHAALDADGIQWSNRPETHEIDGHILELRGRHCHRNNLVDSRPHVAGLGIGTGTSSPEDSN